MNTITIEQIAVLIAVIVANGSMTVDQFTECKQVALNSMMKSINGEPVTADEITIAAYVTRTMQKVKNDAEREAERDAKYATAVAEYERLRQEYAVTMNERFANFVAVRKAALKTEPFATLADLKACFTAFLAELPDAPKEPLKADYMEKVENKKGNKAAREAGTGTGATWNRTADVTKLRDGSTLKVLWDKLVASGETGLTKEEMEQIMFTGFAERSKQNNKFSVYEATAGRLPLVKRERTLEAVDGADPVVVPVWVAVVPVVNDPILEIVKTEGDADTETPKTDGEAAK